MTTHYVHIISTNMYLTYQYYINLFILDLWTYSVKTCISTSGWWQQCAIELREQYIEPQANTRALGLILDYVSLLSHLLQHFHNIFLLTHTPLKFPAPPRLQHFVFNPTGGFSQISLLRPFLIFLMAVLVFTAWINVPQFS